MRYRVKGWQRFQHYKDRNPPWIKLHFSLLSSSDWVILDDHSRALAIVIMLIASKNDGEIDGSEAGLAYLRRVGYLNRPPNLKPLIDCGFLESASGCKQEQAKATTEVEVEKRREETENRRRIASDVISFLNSKAERNFDLNGANAEHVLARLKDGETPEDLRAVIAFKVREWKGTDMAKYLRPETLFNRTKFASYKGELNAVS